MGFPMLATLVFLLYVLGEQRGLAAMTWTLCFLLVVSLACWMKGAFITPLLRRRRVLVVFVLMLGLLVLGSGIYFIGGKFAATKLASASSATRRRRTGSHLRRSGSKRAEARARRSFSISPPPGA